jgi:EmrB/QacA subfamily drug resistance transporter
MSHINVRTLVMPSPVPAVHRWLALPVILAGTFMVTLDFFIVNVAIPSIQRELHAGTAAIEWIVAGYGLSYAALLIIGGRLGDLHGRRRIFRCGVAVFTLASFACGIAPDAGWLVLARITQGVGAALLSPQVLAILGTIYTGAERARAFAAYGVVLGIASACGQLIGGLLIEIDAFGLGWRACFLVNLPVGAGALLLAQVTVPESRGTTSARLDLGGAVLVTLAIGGLLLPLIEGRAHGWPLWTWLSFAAAAAVAMMLVVHQRKRAARALTPLIDPVLLLARGFRTGLLSALVLFAGVASSFFVLALYLQQGRGLAPLPSGLVFTAMALAFTVTSLLAGRIGRSMGRAPLAPGALGMALGLGALMLTVRWIGVGGGSVAWLLPALAVDGAGMGLVMAPLAAAVLAGLPSHHAGAAAGLLVTVQQFANALGVALVGLVFFGLLRHGGYDAAFTASLACLAVLALVLAALVWRLQHTGSRTG